MLQQKPPAKQNSKNEDSCIYWVYICAPIQAPNIAQIAENIYKASLAGAAVYLRGHYPFVPQHNAAYWLQHGGPFTDYEQIVKDYDFAWIARCSLVYAPRELWSQIHASKGCLMELEYAQSIGKHIIYDLTALPDHSARRRTTQDEYGEEWAANFAAAAVAAGLTALAF